jgi:TRAP-type C4-dicarboxylate transport system permease small subunit
LNPSSISRALNVLHMLGALLLALLTLIIVYDVAARLFFNRPFAGTAELTGAGLVLLTFLQAPHVIRERKLLRVTFFVDMLPAFLRSRFNALAYLVGALFFSALVVSAWEPAVSGWRMGEFYGTDAFRVPAWPLRWGCLLLWVLAVAVCVGYALLGLAGRMGETDGQMAEKAEEKT